MQMFLIAYCKRKHLEENIDNYTNHHQYSTISRDTDYKVENAVGT